MILKYIILKKGNTPVFFPNNTINHENIAFGLGEVISAGYCIFKVNSDRISVICYGNSSSLNIASNPEQDVKILENSINSN